MASKRQYARCGEEEQASAARDHPAMVSEVMLVLSASNRAAMWAALSSRSQAFAVADSAASPSSTARNCISLWSTAVQSAAMGGSPLEADSLQPAHAARQQAKARARYDTYQ